MTDRQLFEAYIHQKHDIYADHILAVLPRTDVYRWAETVQRYEDFCAGRSSVVVKLPSPNDVWRRPSGTSTLAECRAAIEAAGGQVIE